MHCGVLAIPNLHLACKHEIVHPLAWCTSKGRIVHKIVHHHGTSCCVTVALFTGIVFTPKRLYAISWYPVMDVRTLLYTPLSVLTHGSDNSRNPYWAQPTAQFQLPGGK